MASTSTSNRGIIDRRPIQEGSTLTLLRRLKVSRLARPRKIEPGCTEIQPRLVCPIARRKIDHAPPQEFFFFFFPASKSSHSSKFKGHSNPFSISFQLPRVEIRSALSSPTRHQNLLPAFTASILRHPPCPTSLQLNNEPSTSLVFEPRPRSANKPSRRNPKSRK